MKIVLVTHYFPDHGGGVERVAGRIAWELADKGDISLDWHASDTDRPPVQPGACITHTGAHAWNWIEHYTGLPFPIWSPAALRALAKAISEADLVHVHDFAYFGSIAAAWLARRFRVPFLLTQHTGNVRPGNRVAAAVYWALMTVFSRGVFEGAHAVIFVSETSKVFWVERLGILRRSVTIWNGVDAPELPSPERLRHMKEAQFFGESRQVILFVGRMVRKKGVAIVRRLATVRPNILFVFAGQGPVDVTEPALPNVYSLGHVDSMRLRTLYFTADLLLLPSLSEGFPLVVQEALVHGLAVLTTDEVRAACPPVSFMLRSCPVPLRDDDFAPWLLAVDAALADRVWIEAREARAKTAASIWSWKACASKYGELARLATRG